MSLNDERQYFAGLQPWLRLPVQIALWVMQLRTGGELARDPDGNITVFGGIRPTITSTWRSLEHQAELRELWEESGAHNGKFYYAPVKAFVYPANKPGESAHNFGLAFDSDVEDQFFPLWNDTRARLGWQLDPDDEVHAELPGWRELVKGLRVA